MNYILLQKHWVSSLKSQRWFYNECVPYPEDDNTPEFLRDSYFVPEFRIQEQEKGWMYYLGAYESHAFARLQLCNDYEPEAGNLVSH